MSAKALLLHTWNAWTIKQALESQCTQVSLKDF